MAIDYSDGIAPPGIRPFPLSEGYRVAMCKFITTIRESRLEAFAPSIFRWLCRDNVFMSARSIPRRGLRFPVLGAGGALLATVLLGVGGCSSTSGNPGLLDQTLQAVGLQKPQPPGVGLDGMAEALPRASLPAVRNITLRLHAGEVLNTGADGRSLSVVARIYKLRDRSAFESSPYSDFQELKPTKPPPFAADIVSVKEVVLTPGKQYGVIESMGSDSQYLAVVALFRAPAAQRWRFVFDSKASVSTGVTLGVHGCALSVAAGQALDAAPETLRLAGVNCQQS